MKFDHAGYRRMAEQGPMVITSFELGDMEAWVRTSGGWRCVMHTETPSDVRH